jgi:hypothetical protein
MKLLTILFLLIPFISFAQDPHHSGDTQPGEFGQIYEKEVGIHTGNGITKLGEFSFHDTHSKTFVLSGNIYFAGHLDLEMVGYDRFQLFLLNTINHHASKIQGVEFETGVKLFGVENQPFGAEPGSSLKFLRVNFTQVDFVSVVNLDKTGAKKIHFKAIAKLGMSKMNQDLATLSESQLHNFQQFFQESQAQIDPNACKWGAHSSVALGIEFELGKFLINTYAEYNYDHALNTLHKNGVDLFDFNYGMHEKKVGIEVEYTLFDKSKYGKLDIFTSAEYYNLTQNVYDINDEFVTKNIDTHGMLFKVGLKYTLPHYNSRKKRKKPDNH